MSAKMNEDRIRTINITRNIDEIHKELFEDGQLISAGPGYLGYAGDLLSLIEQLDQMTANIAKAEGAVEIRYPPSMGISTITRSEYLSNFGHQAIFTAPASNPRDLRTRSYSCEDLGGIEERVTSDQLDPASRVLAPLLCYHVFDMLSARKYAPRKDESSVWTIQGSCHRNEKIEDGRLNRLRSFTMREIICIDKPELVEDFRRRMITKVSGILDKMGIEHKCENANDAFFEAREKKISQRIAGSKIELLVPLGGKTAQMAISSFNLHRSIFLDRFDLKTSKADRWSCCIGFGLERWALAILSRHGIDPRDWPTIIEA